MSTWRSSTDGLRAEREQNITIDVAYRYFATPRRKFIIADTPGHIQYTRNMVTGASTAELAIVLIDARKGVLTQSKRHGFIASLLRIPHIVVAVNKMDLVGYDEACLQSRSSTSTPVHLPAQRAECDLHSDLGAGRRQCRRQSENMPWYDGPTLLHHLEHVNVGASQNCVDLPLSGAVRAATEPELSRLCRPDCVGPHQPRRRSRRLPSDLKAGSRDRHPRR